ncbi:MAG: hypothetical protein M1839_006341 [Geoglossum umbratile]|nr:MAG: hypothetical protein M1839_006341 [Geoglossum umbratile]
MSPFPVDCKPIISVDRMPPVSPVDRKPTVSPVDREPITPQSLPDDLFAGFNYRFQSAPVDLSAGFDCRSPSPPADLSAVINYQIQAPPANLPSVFDSRSPSPTIDLSGAFNYRPSPGVSGVLVEYAKRAIEETPPRGDVTFDAYLRTQRSMCRILELSPNPGMTAVWITHKLLMRDDEHGERLANLFNDIYRACQSIRGNLPNVGDTATPLEGRRLAAVAGVESLSLLAVDHISSSSVPNGVCQITGETASTLDNAGILAFPPADSSGPEFANYTYLIHAMLDRAILLTDGVNYTRNARGQNISEFENMIPMTASCHRAWDNMAFVIEVDWPTYSETTGEVSRALGPFMLYIPPHFSIVLIFPRAYRAV